MKHGKIIRIIALLLGIVLIVSSIFLIRSCSAPPEYSEIADRVKELIEKSYEVNEIVWGKGLPTYERVVSPTASLDIYESGKTYTDENGEEKPLNYHYYYPISEVEGGTVIAYRKQFDYTAKFSYLFLSDKKLEVAELSLLFPVPEGESADSYYSELYANSEAGKLAYSIPFIEKEYDLYYTDSDPADYDYVRTDSPYNSISKIKELVRTVYDKNYANSLDSVLFDGVAEGSLVMKARYSMISNSTGGSMLASLNTYTPLFEEQRIYLFETAKIVRNSSNKERVVVEMLTYLPSEPQNLSSVKVSLVLRDGQWFLASSTY